MLDYEQNIYNVIAERGLINTLLTVQEMCYRYGEDLGKSDHPEELFYFENSGEGYKKASKLLRKFIINLDSKAIAP